MASESKIISAASTENPPMPLLGTAHRDWASQRFRLIEVGIVFGLILVAVWTPQGRFNTYVCWAAAFATVAFSLLDRYSARELGLTRPFSGGLIILLTGAALVGLIAGIGFLTTSIGPPQALPLRRAWQYGLWSLLQQFILESFIYVRLESLYGPLRAVLAASCLFAIAHLPSPLLTALAFLGALFFCQMFRRYRNIYPLGIVHAALGLTIAASLPNSVLHHMRVGIGYLMYHP
jgi:membrane protease YdiL (CAAX protease family)